MFDIGVIGCGPRGLSALESLFLEASKSSKMVRAIVFEKTDWPGAGPVYHPDQPDSNWLNVSERAIDIAPRKEIVFPDFSFPEFPDFQHWSGYAGQSHEDDEVDAFPLRSELGKYLHERYQSISRVLIQNNLMTYEKGEVDNADVFDGGVHIDLVGGQRFMVKEAVLCVGHQPIALDEQLSGWQNRILNLDNATLYTQPYPLHRILESDSNDSESIIAVRGFGLAMIDVLRALTEGKGGHFEITDKDTRKMSYSKSGQEPKQILPFSLDGLPMAPKLSNKKIDSLYVPSEEQLDNYKKAVKDPIESQTKLISPIFLIAAIAPLIVDIFLHLADDARKHTLSESEVYSLVIAWLKNEDTEHELILSKRLSAYEMMKKFAGMATGHEKVSLDFCIGHVWRHCQPTMYQLLSFAPLSDELIADIVALDERLKRYSYGPPIDSIQQVLALVDSGIVNLDLVNNPEIELGEDGWKLTKGRNATIAKTMINSVLDSPQILKVVSPLPKNLMNESVLEPLHDTLGIQTRKNAVVFSKGDDENQSLAVLGRLAKGTLIGVDAIAECFGERSKLWAEGVISRV